MKRQQAFVGASPRARGGRILAAVAFATAVATAGSARAEQRPNEDDMFGAAPAPTAETGAGGAGGAPAAPVPNAPPPAVVPAPPLTNGPGDARDDAMLGDPKAGPRLSQEVAPEDPLKIGGKLYLRTAAQATTGQSLANVRSSAPSLVDGYFDARPNDHVRGFVLGRLFFDPTLPTVATMNTLTSGASSSSLLVPLVSGVQNTRGPTAVLDQLWLRFDILQTVFITAGRQHVKWGTARFWTPTDFLHPQTRNPIASFDARPGFTMVKAHVPWEARGWNFYGFALFEGTQKLDANGRVITGSDSSGTLGQVGAAARAEVVLGTTEVGVDTVLYRGRRPKIGADMSFGFGDLDLYADAGLRFANEVPLRGYDAADIPFTYDPSMAFQPQLDAWVDQKYPVYRPTGLKVLSLATGVKPQVTVGGTYQFKYNDNDVFTVTGEYFYNSLGYADPHVYPGLFLSNSFQFFYTGRHYAALSAIAAAPYSWNYTTFTLTTLANLSDQSFITRLDYSLLILTHLTFEAFGAADYGHTAGEFRLGVNGFTVPTMTGNQVFSIAPQAFSFGLGLRINI